MALIRKSMAQTLAREAIVLDLGDLVRQADAIKAKARADAEAIVAEGRAERERLITGAAEEGRAQGLAKGLEEGRTQGQAEGRQAALAEFKERLGKLEVGWTAGLAAFDAERDRMLLEARQDIVRLAASVAELVAKRVVSLNPETVNEQVGAVLALLSKPTRLMLLVNPDDEATVRQALPALCQKYSAAAHVDLGTDASIARGGCVAKTAGGGVIDATITAQLERIAEALLPERPAAPGAGT
jgi:flagellar biosynthesis/type III secretory pathway protein FliH